MNALNLLMFSVWFINKFVYCEYDSKKSSLFYDNDSICFINKLYIVDKNQIMQSLILLYFRNDYFALDSKLNCI